MAKSSTRRVTIYINGKEVEASVKQIRSEMNKLVNEQNRRSSARTSTSPTPRKSRSWGGTSRSTRRKSAPLPPRGRKCTTRCCSSVREYSIRNYCTPFNSSLNSSSVKIVSFGKGICLRMLKCVSSHTLTISHSHAQAVFPAKKIRPDPMRGFLSAVPESGRWCQEPRSAYVRRSCMEFWDVVHAVRPAWTGRVCRPPTSGRFLVAPSRQRRARWLASAHPNPPASWHWPLHSSAPTAPFANMSYCCSLSGKRGSNPRFSDTVPTTFCDFVIRCKWVNYIFHKRRFWLPFVSFLSQYKAIKITDFQSVIEGFDAPFPIRKKRCIFLWFLKERKIL